MQIERLKNHFSIKDILFILGIPTTKNIKTPLKNEKNPSLRIYYDTNTFCDYSASVSGDQLELYAYLRQIPKSMAIEELVKRIQPVKKMPRKLESEFKFLAQLERDLFEERASIMEYEGNAMKCVAEKLSYESIYNYRREIQKSIFQALYEFELNDIDDTIVKYLIVDRKMSETSISKFKLFTIKNPRNTIQYLRDKFSDYELLVSGLFVADHFIFKKHRLIIPYVERGMIRYIRARYFDKDHNNGKYPKYKSVGNVSRTLEGKRFYNVDVLDNHISEILLLEGEFDTIIASQFGYPAIGIPGVSSFPEKQIELLQNLDVCILFDNDDPGKKTAIKVAQILTETARSIKKWKLPQSYKDLTEYANAIT